MFRFFYPTIVARQTALLAMCFRRWTYKPQHAAPKPLLRRDRQTAQDRWLNGPLRFDFQRGEYV